MVFENPIAEITDYSSHLGGEVPKKLNFRRYMLTTIYVFTVILFFL